MVYKERFKTSEKEHSDKDIFTVETKDIPNHDLLVGDFRVRIIPLRLL